jgi:hypothetical protein
MFKDIEDEHITLEYVGSYPEWKELLMKCEAWANKFAYMPVTVEVNGYANWLATNNGDHRYFDVALVAFREYPELTYQKNWHITLGKDTKPIKPRQFDIMKDVDRFDICDDIWIGYKKPTGETAWIRYLGNRGTLNPEELEYRVKNYGG